MAGTEGIRVTATLQGAEAMQRKFATLQRKVSGTIVKKSVRAGIAPLHSALRKATEYTTRTGLLRRSFRVRVTAKHHGLVTTGRTTSSVKSSRGKKPPMRAGYAWLVEHGHRIAVGKSGASEKDVILRRRDGHVPPNKSITATSAGEVRGRYFGRAAFRREKQAAQQRFTDKFKVEVSQAANG